MPNKSNTRSSKQGSKNSVLPLNPTSYKHYVTHYDKLNALEIEHVERHTNEYPCHRVSGGDRAITDYVEIDFETSDHTVNPGGQQLQLWAYETSNTNITIAERLEKAKWVTERAERL